MSFTPDPQHPDELEQFELLLDAIDQAQRPWWQRMWMQPCFVAVALGQVVQRRWAEWRGW
jgi:hypothetical protein